jgi:5'-nucleotidase
MKTRQMSRAIALIFVCAGMACASKTVNLKIVAINDFHGQLESPGGLHHLPADAAATVPVGGVDWLAGYIADIKSKNPNTVVVSAGDLMGATPLVSALFHDEGTIETMNRAGLEINAVGNHEFDEGRAELLRMQNGGCHPTDTSSCQGAAVGTPVPFEGADFKFLAANVVDGKSGDTLFPSYTIKAYQGVKVAFIGLTLKETPTIATPSGVAGLGFRDEATTVNRLIPKLHALGARAIVVLIHQGGATATPQALSTLNACDGNLDGSPIKAIVNRLSDGVSAVITGHTHALYNCTLTTHNGVHTVPVTAASSQGRVVTEIDMALAAGGGVLKTRAVNVAVDRTNTAITPNAKIKLIVDNYKALVGPIANRFIGSITETLSKTNNAAGESALGDIIADAQREATTPVKFGGAQIAFMNPGGIRADLAFLSSSTGEGDGKVTFGELFTVQPFGNSLVTLTLTGAQIEQVLEQQFVGCANGQTSNRILSPSAGFSYAWNAAGAGCDKIDPASIMLNGIALNPAADYRVTVNSFLASGGDQFTVLAQGKKRLGGAQDHDALVAYFTAHSPVAPRALDRVLLIP